MALLEGPPAASLLGSPAVLWGKKPSPGGDHKPQPLSREPLSGSAHPRPSGPFFWGDGWGENPRNPTWRAPGG